MGRGQGALHLGGEACHLQNPLQIRSLKPTCSSRCSHAGAARTGARQGQPPTTRWGQDVPALQASCCKSSPYITQQSTCTAPPRVLVCIAALPPPPRCLQAETDLACQLCCSGLCRGGSLQAASMPTGRTQRVQDADGCMWLQRWLHQAPNSFLAISRACMGHAEHGMRACTGCSGACTDATAQAAQTAKATDAAHSTVPCAVGVGVGVAAQQRGVAAAAWHRCACASLLWTCTGARRGRRAGVVGAHLLRLPQLPALALQRPRDLLLRQQLRAHPRLAGRQRRVVCLLAGAQLRHLPKAKRACVCACGWVCGYVVYTTRVPCGCTRCVGANATAMHGGLELGYNPSLDQVVLSQQQPWSSDPRPLKHLPRTALTPPPTPLPCSLQLPPCSPTVSNWAAALPPTWQPHIIVRSIPTRHYRRQGPGSQQTGDEQHRAGRPTTATANNLQFALLHSCRHVDGPAAAAHRARPQHRPYRAKRPPDDRQTV